MTKKKEGITLIMILIVGSLIWVGFNYDLQIIKEEKKVNCYYDDSGWYSRNTTEKECDERKAKYNARKNKRIKEAKELGCVKWREDPCRTIDGKIYKNVGSYDRDTEDYVYSWKETEQSKLCAKYYDYRVADLPVKCLDYWGLKDEI